MKKTTLYFRNFINNALIVMLSFVILGGIFTGTSYQLLLRQQHESLTTVSGQLVRVLAAFSDAWELDSFPVRIITNSLGSASHVNILVTDENGLVVSCSDPEITCEHMGRQVSTELLERLAGLGKARRTDLGGVYRSRKNILCAPIAVRGEPEGYVLVSGEKDVGAVLWQDYAGLYLMLAVVVMLLTFLATYLSTKKQAEPIMDMAAAAERFARGDYASRVSYSGSVYEIDALADAFNKMAESVERSENNRREFVANVSHELKTPMTSIAGFADGILDGTIPREKQNEYLAIISSETRRLSRLVRSMLDMSQLQAQDRTEILRKSFDLCEVLCLALVGLEHKITEKGLDVDARIPEEPITVRGDRDAINQVIYNLIDNAAKFAPAGTVLRLAAWKQGGKAFVSVENDGETISPEELPLIFDRFHKTDRSRSLDRDGVGLGLYIVKTILDNHNEYIYVTSRDGVTRFVFTMTLAVRNPPSRPEA